MLKIERVTKSFDGQVVLRDVSLEVAAGSVTVLLGPSGCGKTTLLRIVAGLEQADAGRLLLDGSDLAGVPPFRRGFGFVFQDYALFPHKSVADNVAFGLRMAGWEAARVRARVEAALEWVGLAGFGGRAVHELSGGEQQRVALARSLAPAPRLLLLDEPLGALDRALRERLVGELRPILRQAGGHNAGITAIYVTHDQAEAFALADQVALLNAGRLEQQGTPQTIYHAPATAFVARFLGMHNLLPAQVLSRTPPVVKTNIGILRVANVQQEAGAQITLLVKPEAAQVDAVGANVIEVELLHVSFRGRFQLAAVQVGGERLLLEFDSTQELPPPGQLISIGLQPHLLLPLTTGADG
ncbi:MAG: ABC transporter ATP-binding protein [Candidatus Promineifilaceae bacterium]